MTSPQPAGGGRVARNTVVVVAVLVGIFCGLPLLLCATGLAWENLFGGHG